MQEENGARDPNTQIHHEETPNETRLNASGEKKRKGVGTEDQTRPEGPT